MLVGHERCQSKQFPAGRPHRFVWTGLEPDRLYRACLSGVGPTDQLQGSFRTLPLEPPSVGIAIASLASITRAGKQGRQQAHRAEGLEEPDHRRLSSASEGEAADRPVATADADAVGVSVPGAEGGVGEPLAGGGDALLLNGEHAAVAEESGQAALVEQQPESEGSAVVEAGGDPAWAADGVMGGDVVDAALDVPAVAATYGAGAEGNAAAEGYTVKGEAVASQGWWAAAGDGGEWASWAQQQAEYASAGEGEASAWTEQQAGDYDWAGQVPEPEAAVVEGTGAGEGSVLYDPDPAVLAVGEGQEAAGYAEAEAGQWAEAVEGGGEAAPVDDASLLQPAAEEQGEQEGAQAELATEGDGGWAHEAPAGAAMADGAEVGEGFVPPRAGDEEGGAAKVESGGSGLTGEEGAAADDMGTAGEPPSGSTQAAVGPDPSSAVEDEGQEWLAGETAAPPTASDGPLEVTGQEEEQAEEGVATTEHVPAVAAAEAVAVVESSTDEAAAAQTSDGAGGPLTPEEGDDAQAAAATAPAIDSSAQAGADGEQEASGSACIDNPSTEDGPAAGAAVAGGGKLVEQSSTTTVVLGDAAVEGEAEKGKDELLATAAVHEELVQAAAEGVSKTARTTAQVTIQDAAPGTRGEEQPPESDPLGNVYEPLAPPNMVDAEDSLWRSIEVDASCLRPRLRLCIVVGAPAVVDDLMARARAVMQSFPLVMDEAELARQEQAALEALEEPARVLLRACWCNERLRRTAAGMPVLFLPGSLHCPPIEPETPQWQAQWMTGFFHKAASLFRRLACEYEQALWGGMSPVGSSVQVGFDRPQAAGLGNSCCVRLPSNVTLLYLDLMVNQKRRGPLSIGDEQWAWLLGRLEDGHAAPAAETSALILVTDIPLAGGDEAAGARGVGSRPWRLEDGHAARLLSLLLSWQEAQAGREVVFVCTSEGCGEAGMRLRDVVTAAEAKYLSCGSINKAGQNHATRCGTHMLGQVAPS